MWEFLAIAAGMALDVTGADQEAREETIRQGEIKRQALENKEMAKLAAEQQATQRSRSYSNFLRSTSATAGFNRRADDRSLKAIQEAGKKKTTEELQAIRLQSLFTQGRYASQAAYADFETRSAQSAALMSQMSTVISGGQKMYNVSGSSPKKTSTSSSSRNSGWSNNMAPGGM
tara:strand:+ start:425 stop:946 length:522 start_codon:yes stop_codon:yes gene_type:complete